MNRSFFFPGRTFTLFLGAPSIIFLLSFLIFLGVLIFIVVKGLRQWGKNNASPILDVAAVVVGKRTDVSHHHHGGNHMHHSANTSYYVTFEFDSGSRIELSVDGTQYGQMAQGDAGTLRFQGTRFLGFERLIQRRDL